MLNPGSDSTLKEFYGIDKSKATVVCSKIERIRFFEERVAELFAESESDTAQKSTKEEALEDLFA